MNLTICSECGKQVNEDANYCPSCGIKLPDKNYPPVSMEIEQFSNEIYYQKEQLRKKKRDKIFFITIAVLIILIYISIRSEPENIPPTTVPKVEITTIPPTTVNKENLPPIAITEEPKKYIKGVIKDDLTSWKEPFDSDLYRGTVDDLQREVLLFIYWAKIIKDGEESTDDETNKLASKLKRKLIDLQVKEFPKLRQEYSKYAADELWLDNIYVTTSGDNNDILNITGGVFASNRNIAEMQVLLSGILTQLRFREVRYRWYKGASEYTRYNLGIVKDSEVE